MPDVEINGVAYRLAEDAEGEHYSLSAEPLRPPNAVTVQGEDSQKFQMRPDTLLWSLADWSGGEGQHKFDPEQGNRWRELEGVRAFDPPGKLAPGWPVRELTDGTNVVVEDGGLVKRRDVAYLFDAGGPNVRKWSGTGGGQWSAQYTFTGPTNGAGRVITSDGNYIYWSEYGTNNVWKWDGNTFGLSPTQIDSGTMPVIYDPGVAELGSYVYVYAPTEGKVWEIPKAGGGDTLIDDFSDNAGLAITGESSICVANGRIYVVVHKYEYTAIREITPTSAAGAGFGAEIAKLPGTFPYAMWSHLGLLYLICRIGNETFKAGVFYVQPGGEYGSLGEVRPVGTTSTFATTGQQNGDVVDHFFVASPGETHKIHQIDAISGNMAVIAVTDSTQPADQTLYFGDYGVIWGTDTLLSGRRTYQARADSYAVSSSAVSPWNDFALADEKILSSLVLAMEKLPADWRVRVDYAINGEDTWTNVIDDTTLNSNGEKIQVSTDTATVKFRTLSIRIRMDYTGASDPPTTGPTILGVDALAMVAKPTKVWRLLLDLSDSKSRAVGVSGSRQATNLSTAADTESVVAFKDYYGSSTPGTAEEHDVIIDSYAMVLSQPGEGVAAVTLKETS